MAHAGQVFHVADNHLVEVPCSAGGGLGVQLDPDITAVGIDALVVLTQGTAGTTNLHDQAGIGRQQPKQIGVEHVVIVELACAHVILCMAIVATKKKQLPHT